MENLADPASEGQLVLRQRFSNSSRRLRAAALTAAGLLLCAPFVMLLGLDQPAAQLSRLAATNPLAALQLALAALLSVAALICGLCQLLRPAIRERVIAFEGDKACVEETVRGRQRRWQEPVDGYRGIRHKVFTTSEGVVHALLLEHHRPNRSLHIAYEPHIADKTILDASRRYGLPVLKASRRRDYRSLTLAGLTAWMNGISRPTTPTDRLIAQ
jgi:hypothetical protein